MKIDHSRVIEKACRLIAAQDFSSASQVITTEYPFNPYQRSGRAYTPRMMTKIFVRDGFIDRYRGTRLIYPPALRLLSLYLPSEFPYHKNGKMTEGHMAYWELFPTIDHVVPVAYGGVDSEENWVCCSMLTNSIKSNWTLEQLQWQLLPSGNITEWDGMISWFVQQISNNLSILENTYIKRWYGASKEFMHTYHSS